MGAEHVERKVLGSQPAESAPARRVGAGLLRSANVPPRATFDARLSTIMFAGGTSRIQRAATRPGTTQMPTADAAAEQTDPPDTDGALDTDGKVPELADRERTTLLSDVKLKRNGRKVERRSTTAGSVAITIEAVELWVNDERTARTRPVEVIGMVEPTVTSGRGGAPDPLSGIQIYMGTKGQLDDSIPAVRNMGMIDADRGHLMALELGGPDIAENIVPQWSGFQSSGAWRRMEVEVLEAARALPQGRQLRYHVSVTYKETGVITPTIRSFGVPTGFRVTTQVCDLTGKPLGPPDVVFDRAQAQDATDFKLAERVMARQPRRAPAKAKAKPGKSKAATAKATKHANAGAAGTRPGFGSPPASSTHAMSTRTRKQ